MGEGEAEGPEEEKFNKLVREAAPRRGEEGEEEQEEVVFSLLIQ